MKKVLITGANGYIGSMFKEWVEMQKENEIEIDFISLKDNSWKENSFENYDSVVHLAGIAHVSKNKKLKEMYYKINKNLTLEVARKAKMDGVKHFVFLSSIIVFGNKFGRKKIIDKNTKPIPSDFYGDSKLQAEIELLKMNDDNNFKVCIVRSPMVYGPFSKGNYNKLSKLSGKIKLFPYFENRRSMIFIFNLTECIKLIILNSISGTIHPQNNQYVSTINMMKEISHHKNNKIYFFKGLDSFIRIISINNSFLNKIFGDLAYDDTMNNLNLKYNVFSFEESIKITELRNKGD